LNDLFDREEFLDTLFSAFATKRYRSNEKVGIHFHEGDELMLGLTEYNGWHHYSFVRVEPLGAQKA